jgi:Ca2+-binding RTX toxin-like protein
MNGDANGPAAADVIDGGGGYDYITDEWGEDAASPAAIDVSVDGAANDGRAGERDNVVGVERIWVANPGRVAGSSGPDDIYVYPASGSSTVLGMAGNDMVKGGDSAETVDGGSGADKVVGGRGDDVVVGGPGPDTLYGDNDAGGCGPIICAIQIGNDTIRARDGERDSIDCGVGSDTAVVDAVDVVANCEQVDRGAAGGGGGGAGGGGGGGGRLALTLPKKPSLRSLAGGGVRIGVACTARCSVKLKVTAAKALARKLRAGKSRVVATGSGKRSSAGKLNVRLTVPSKLRARLRRLGSARLTLEVAVTQAGSKSVVKKALKLKR